MTQSTEQERAEFEAAYVAEKLRIIGSEGSTDGEKAIRAVMLRRNASGDYDNSFEAHFAWWAWQVSAARRAPVTPQQWKITEEMHVAAVKVFHRASGLDGLPQRMVDAMLAAAPQPPACNPSMQPELATQDHFPGAGKMAAKHCDLCKSDGGYYYGKSGYEPCCV